MAPGGTFAYDPRDFPPFAVTVDIAVFTIRDDALHVLLIQRGGEPYLGAWALPGGFVRPDEDLDRAAERELAEETGLDAGSWYLEQLGSYGAPERDPRMRVVTVAYWAIAADLPAPRGGGDALDAALTPVRDIEGGRVRLAFDHERIVRDAVERTRSKLEYTALAAKFCPPEFTIRQLRQVYEAVWNTRLDPGNFQRNVQESGAFVQRLEAPPRPASGRRAPRLALVRRCGDVRRRPARSTTVATAGEATGRETRDPWSRHVRRESGRAADRRGREGAGVMEAGAWERSRAGSGTQGPATWRSTRAERRLQRGALHATVGQCGSGTRDCGHCTNGMIEHVSRRTWCHGSGAFCSVCRRPRTRAARTRPASGSIPLKGDRAGWWSVRVSGNWRVVFRFENGEVVDVDLVDHH